MQKSKQQAGGCAWRGSGNVPGLLLGWLSPRTHRGVSSAPRNLGGGSSAPSGASPAHAQALLMSRDPHLEVLGSALALLCCLVHPRGMVCRVSSTAQILPQGQRQILLAPGFKSSVSPWASTQRSPSKGSLCDRTREAQLRPPKSPSMMDTGDAAPSNSQIPLPESHCFLKREGEIITPQRPP